jgi:hypothetical protein
LMELAFLLRSVGAEVCWITVQKPAETDEVIYSLEHKMLDRGVKVISLLAYIVFVFPCLLRLSNLRSIQIPPCPSLLEPNSKWLCIFISFVMLEAVCLLPQSSIQHTTI